MKFVLSVLSLSLLFITACQSPSNGPALAEQYCQSCHQLPLPEQLDQTTWSEHVLPRMRYFVGLDQIDPQSPPDWWEGGEAGQKVLQSGAFPQQAMMTEREWQVLHDYFVSNALAQLSVPDLGPIDSLSQFSLSLPAFRLGSPSTTLLQIPEQGGLILGDANTQKAYFFDQQLVLQQAAATREAAVHVHETSAAYYLTVMGSFSPTDAPKGFLMALSKQAGQAKVLLPDLQRPVHAEYADIDGDALLDILVSEFGKWSGGLAWWQGKPDGSFSKQVLRPVSGATQAFARDLNADGRLDVIALFAQGEEGVFVFWNEGEEKFRSEQVLRFPPSSGSASMQLLDWDEDGQLDILLSQGDNADYPPIVKAYHGLRLWHNEGEGRFAERFFLPLPGAYETEVHDFDGDGDQDIAAIAFFPDYKSEDTRSFVYYENQGGNQFKAQSFAGLSQLGRWLVMDVGDIDQDGDIDLALGSLAFEVPGQSSWTDLWQRQGIAFVVLENEWK
ncbi:MAG: VCBS repeat-containing protein [Bacteroidota bacterium]